MSKDSAPPDSETLPEPSTTPPPGEDELEDYEPLTPELVEDEAIRGDFVLKWAVVLLAFLLASTRIGETPSLVHIKSGQYLTAHGWLPPANDVFSYTAVDRPWTNLSWGFDLLAATVHAAGAFAGMSLFKALLAAVMFGLIVHTSRLESPTWWGSICALLALLACHLRLTMQPTLITLLGTAVVLWILHGWRQASPGKPSLWLLVPAFLVWANLDSRAFLGLGVLLLFAVGEAVAAGMKAALAQSAEQRKQLWLVVGASLAAMLVHPFGYKSLMAPWYVYGVDYPAFREYIQGAYLALNVPPIWPGLIYFPMTTPSFWSQLDLATAAGLAMLAMPAVLFVLNARRPDPRHILIYAGCLGLAIASIHELAWAAVVCAVLATLEGQTWYAATCRQTYTIDTSELVFSRGGRVLTVLVFAAIGLFGGTGRLRESRFPRTGYGLDHGLATSIDDLQKQLAGDASFDHRPFNQLLTQGDVLIWIGEQVFADNRVAVYYAPEPSRNLLLAHSQTRDALRPPRDKKPDGSAVSRRSAWKSTFDEYGLTHIVLRMSLDTLSGIDYEAMLGLLHDEYSWQWTSLGPTAAVFYRRDVRNPALTAFVAENAIDFHERAYREEQIYPLPRDQHVRPPSFYQRYFWSSKRDITPEVQQAVHLVRLASLPLPRKYEEDRTALAFLAIRLAQAGLVNDPDAAAGYLALGQAYQILAESEAAHALNNSRSPYSGTRYTQAVASYNQALVADPDNQTAHFALATMYQRAQRPELALRHIEELERLLSKDRSIGRDDVAALSETGARLRGMLAAYDGELAQAPGGDAGLQQRVSYSLSRGCVLRALEDLDAQAAMMAGNPSSERLRILLLLEAGRIDEAYEAAQRFAEVAARTRVPEWAHVVALTYLTEANYKMAVELWTSDVEQIQHSALNNVLMTLAPKSSTAPWPLGTLQSGSELLYNAPENVATHNMEIALVLLEAGQLKMAEESFRDVLTAEPETPYRPLVAYYLYQLTGKDDVDLLPPSEMIPILFAPEPGTEPEPAGAPQ